MWIRSRSRPSSQIADALELMQHYSISGVPVTENGKLVGILTNRDLRFETRFDLPIAKVMTKDNLITVPVGTTLEEAERILHQHRVEKLLVVDDAVQSQGPDHGQGYPEEDQLSQAPPRTSAGACEWGPPSASPAISSSAPRSW